MGIFSFLKKDKDSDNAGGVDVSPAPTDATAASAVATESADTPFHPPEAWNLDALTAPPPAPAAGTVPEIGPMDTAKTAEYQQKIIDVIKTVYDPEIPVDIYELGLIYQVDIDDDRNVRIEMTLTAPGCPVAGEMPGWVENAVSTVAGVASVQVKIVFDPPWDQSRMSDEARVALNVW